MPFDKSLALVMSEAPAFQDGRYQLHEWPEYVHAGSIAQIMPFVDPTRGTPEAHVPHGIVKLAFPEQQEVMRIDFRLLKSKVKLIELTGHFTRGASRLGPLRPTDIVKIKEVLKIMLSLETEILQEFNLSHEARRQEEGGFVLESLLEDTGENSWLEAWRNEALLAVLQPAGPDIAGRAQEAWRTGRTNRWIGTGWMSRLAMRAYGGQSFAEQAVDGQAHLSRLRSAIHGLKICVPKIHQEACGPHVLAMDLAKGHSLKDVLDVVELSAEDIASRAAAWFAILLLFVIVPLWGKMLLALGCCHADPHPGNFKVDGIPGLDDDMQVDSSSGTGHHGAAASLFRRGTSPHPFTFTILDWGSCVNLPDNTRKVICRLLLSLGELRRAQMQTTDSGNDGVSHQAEQQAVRKVAACMRELGVQADDGRDSFLAALGMVLFDPSVANQHPELRGGRADELSVTFPPESDLGKVLRVIAILVGLCRELETRVNAEVAERFPSMPTGGPFLQLFLVDLWHPFAEEGLDA